MAIRTVKVMKGRVVMNERSSRRLRGAFAVFGAVFVSVFLLGSVCVAPVFAMTGEDSLKRGAHDGAGGDDRRVRRNVDTSIGDVADLTPEQEAAYEAELAQQINDDAHGLLQQLQAAEAAAFPDPPSFVPAAVPSPPAATPSELRRRQEQRHHQPAQAHQQQQAQQQQQQQQPQVPAQMQVPAQPPAVSPEVAALASVLAQAMSAPGGSGTAAPSAAAAAAATAAATNSTAVPSMEALLSAIYTVSPTGLGVGALSCAAPGGAAAEKARGVLQQFFGAIAAAVPAPALAPAPLAGPSPLPASTVVPSAAVCTRALVVF
jgi:hypothetical protein